MRSMSGVHYKYILVGGGVASSAAAQAIRQRDRQGSLLLIGQEINRPYRRPPLNKEYLKGTVRASDLFTVPDKWFSENSVELRTGRRASHLDPTRSSLTLDDGSEIAFDRLLIATGGTPRHLAIPGAELPNIFYLRNLEDADRLHHAVEKARRDGRTHDRGRGRVAVIGGGLLGVELAATFADMGLHVDLLMSSAHVWPKFAGETAGRFILRSLENHGVTVNPKTLPLRLEGDGRVQRIILPDQKSLDCDLVVSAIGMMPNKELIRATTLAAEKAILVDQHCRTSDPNIYAAGDCAAIFDPLFGKYRILDHSDSAALIGALAGANMAGENHSYNSVSRFTTKIFDITASVWGDARHVERRIVRGIANVESPDFIEFGIASAGRIAEILAVNHPGEDDLLQEMVARRLNIDGQDTNLRDPAINLNTLLK